MRPTAFVLPAIILVLPSEAHGQAAPAPQDKGTGGAAQVTINPAPNTMAPDIVVTAQKRAVEETIDRTVYNIAASPDAASSSTLEVLKRLPGVFVGPSGGVTIRGGAKVSYLVDGKPTRREIAEAISAGQIERVEVIANPPAEYDSSSGALINIVLKRNAKAGWSGTTSGSIDTLGGYRAGVDLALGTPSWKFNGSLSYFSSPLESNISRTTNFSPTPSSNSISRQVLDVEDQRTTERLGFQLKAFRKSSNDNNTSILFGGSYNRIPETQNVLQTVQGGTGASASSLSRLINFNGFYPYATISLTRRLTNNLGMDLGLQINRGNSQQDRITSGDISQIVVDHIAFTYVEPSLKISRKVGAGSLSVGFAYSFNPVSERLSIGSGLPTDLPTTSAFNFETNRKIFSTYIQYEGNIYGIGFKPSLRYESITQNFSNFDTDVAGLRHIGLLLPSLNLSKKINDNSTLKASLTFKTERPDGLDLNPFVQVISPFYVKTGNPFLRPSVKRQADLSYVYEKKGTSLSQTVYYRSSKDDISRVLLTDSALLTTESFANLGSSQTYGYNANAKGNLSKDVQYGIGFDIFHRDLVAPTPLAELGRVEFTSVNANGTLDFKIDAQTSLSSQLTYVGPVSDISVTTPRYLNSELRIRRDLGHRITASLLLADVGVPLERVGQFNGLNLNGTERTRQKTRLVRMTIAKTF